MYDPIVRSFQVGDKIGIYRRTTIGWGNFRYPTVDIKTIKRLTPAKAKIITEDGCEYSPRNTNFVPITEQTVYQNKVAKCAVNIGKTLDDLETRKRQGKLFSLDDDKLVAISALMDKLREVVWDE